MDTYRYNSTSSYAQRPAASERMAGAQASAADRLWAAPASRGTRRSAAGTGHASVGAERRARARTRRSNFMRYATDNRVVQTLYAITTGPWRFAFYGAVALAVAVSIYFPARDYYAAYRTGDILSRQLEVREAYNKELEAKVDKLLSTEGIEETARKKLGLVMNITDLGADRSMLDDLVKSTLVMQGGYKVLTKEEIRQIFEESL